MTKEKTQPDFVAKCGICRKAITKQDVMDGKAYPINFPGDPFKFACNHHHGVMSMSMEAGYLKDVKMSHPEGLSMKMYTALQIILPCWVGGQYQWVNEVNEYWKNTEYTLA